MTGANEKIQSKSIIDRAFSNHARYIFEQHREMQREYFLLQDGGNAF